MNAYKWFALAICVLGSIATISQIGKPREPLTANIALLACTLNASVAVAVVLA